MQNITANIKCRVQQKNMYILYTYCILRVHTDTEKEMQKKSSIVVSANGG